MTTKYLLRFDDACAFMDSKKWARVEKICDENGIKPLVGIIPHNEDSVTMIETENKDFQTLVHSWISKGWQIALHGYSHVCTTNSGGINAVHNRSEFAGLPYEEQCKKLLDGYKILQNLCYTSDGGGYRVKYFFAPSHTFDKNTLRVLREKTEIKIVSDTWAFKPYRYQEMTIVPCQMGRFRNIKLPGYFTFCYHPNTMNENDFIYFEKFLKTNREKFIGFDELPLGKLHGKSLAGKLANFAYLTLHKLKGN